MLHNRLLILFPNFKQDDWELQDDGGGPYIRLWNRPEPQPTQAQIDAVTEADLSVIESASDKARRVAHILATQGEGKDRTTLQLAIQVAELTATVQAPLYGMTAAQAIAYAYTKNATYKRSKDTEAAIRAVELEP